MPPFSWDRVLSVDLEKLDDAAVESWYEELLKTKVDKEDDIEKLRALFRLTRTVLEIKGTQAELAMEQAMEELKQLTQETSKAGAEREEALLAEIQTLKQQISEHRKQTLSRDRTKDSPAALAEISALKDESSDLRKRIKQMEEAEIKYIEDRERSEELETKLKQSEKTLKDLRLECDKLREDVNDYQRQLETQRETITIRRGEDDDLQKILRTKNQEMLQLLDEINWFQNLTDARTILEQEVIRLKLSLEDSNAEMDKTTDRYIEMQKALLESDSALEALQRENTDLRAQQTAGAKSGKPTLETELLAALDKKIEEWKGLLESKDQELLFQKQRIQELQGQLNQLSMDADRVNVVALTKAIEDKDTQLNMLREELNKGREEMERNADIMEELRIQTNMGGSRSDTQQRRMAELQARLKDKEQVATIAEENAKKMEAEAIDREKQIADLLARNHKYEKGIYGLAEAVDEINDLKRQVSIRDRQIESLVQHGNSCEVSLNELLEQNEELRERVGLEKRAPLDFKFRHVKQVERESDKALNIILNKEIEKLEEERLQLKLQMRQLAQRSGERAVALGLTADDLVAIDQFTEELKTKHISEIRESVVNVEATTERPRVASVSSRRRPSFSGASEDVAAQFRSRSLELEAENTMLRRGLNELQQQIKTWQKSGGPATELQVPSLDRLCAVLEARILEQEGGAEKELLSDLEQLRGRNEELRSELKSTRLELQAAGVEALTARKEIEKLQELLSVSEGARKAALNLPKIELPKYATASASVSKIIDSLNEHLVKVLYENVVVQEQLNKAKAEGEELQRKHDILKGQQESLYEEYIEERKRWEAEFTKIQDDNRQMKEVLDISQTKIEEFDHLLDNLNTDDVELRRRLAELTRKFTVSRINEKILTRKYNAQLEVEAHLRSERDKFEKEANYVESLTIDRLNKLQSDKALADFHIQSLQKQLNQTWPRAEYEGLNRQFIELSEKYRQLLEKESSGVGATTLKEDTQQLISQLSQGNRYLETQLEAEREKLHKLELLLEASKINGIPGSVSVTEMNQFDLVSKRITTLEMKELNERQKANHAQAMYEQQRDQLLRTEQRTLELEQKFAELAKVNIELQNTEVALRDELAACISKDVHENVLKRLSNAEGGQAELAAQLTQLKSMSEVWHNQVLFYQKKLAELNVQLVEAEAVVRDLQSMSDYRAIIGKLHLEIVRLKLKDISGFEDLELAKSRLHASQNQILRLERQLEEREQSMRYVRSEAQHKETQLKRTIASMRQRYAGAVTLVEYEKFSIQMRHLREEQEAQRERMTRAVEREEQALLRAAELELMKSSLEELKAALQDTDKSSEKVSSWHAKLEELRLIDLKNTRQIKQLSLQLKSKDEEANALAATIEMLEEKVVRQTKEMDGRELFWENREQELERRLSSLSRQEAQREHEMLKYELSPSGLPDPSLPLVVQLDEALKGLRKYLDTIAALRKENDQLKTKLDTSESTLKKLELELLRKERSLASFSANQIAPFSMEAELHTTVSDNAELALSKAQEFQRARNLLQITIDSLKERLVQKDAVISTYEQLLQQTQDQFARVTETNSSEVAKLYEQLKQQAAERLAQMKERSDDLFRPVHERTEVENLLAQNASLTITISEQQLVIAQLTQQLNVAKEELLQLKIELQMLERNEVQQQREPAVKSNEQRPSPSRKRPHRRSSEELDSAPETSANITPLPADAKAPPKTVDNAQTAPSTPPATNQKSPSNSSKSSRKSSKSEAVSPTGEIAKLPIVVPLPDEPSEPEPAKLAQPEKITAQTTAKIRDLKLTITKLRNELSNRNKEINALNLVIKELEAKATHITARDDFEITGQEAAKELERKLGLQRREVRRLKEAEKHSLSEIEELRNEVGRKDASIARLRIEKTTLEKEVGNLEIRIGHLRDSMKMRLHETENRELKTKIASLEDQLRLFRKSPPDRTADDYRDKNVVLLRWEEGKKLQQQCDKLKEKLNQRSRENEEQAKQLARLRSLNTRLGSEKLVLENELSRQKPSATTTATSTVATSKTDQSTALQLQEKVSLLQEQNKELQEELFQVRFKLESVGLTVDEAEDLKAEAKRLKTEIERLQDISEPRAYILQPPLELVFKGLMCYTKLQKRNSGAMHGFEQSAVNDVNFDLDKTKTENKNLKKSISNLKEFFGEGLFEYAIVHCFDLLRPADIALRSPISIRFNPEGKSAEELRSMVIMLKKTVDILYQETRTYKNQDNVNLLNQLRKELEQVTENCTRLQEENEELRHDLENPRAANIQTINRLHDMVDTLESEKQQLEQQLSTLQLDKHTGAERNEIRRLIEENQELKLKLRKTAPRVAWAEQMSSDSGRQAATKLAAENDRLRRELKKEQATVQKLSKELREAVVSKEKLEAERLKWQRLSANTRKWQPTATIAAGTASSDETSMRQRDEQLQRMAADRSHLEEVLKQEIEKCQQFSQENRRLRAMLDALQYSPSPNRSTDSSLREFREQRSKIADLEATNSNLRRQLDVLERQLKPAWEKSIGSMDFTVVTDRLKLYDNVLQENIDLKLERNALQRDFECGRNR